MQTSMSNETRARFREFQSRIAELNGMPAQDVIGGATFEVSQDIQAKAFSRLTSFGRDQKVTREMQFAAGAAPTADQRLVQRRQDTIAFLSLINVLGVRDLIGMPVGMNMTGMIAGRTNTTGGTQRHGRNPMSLDNFPFLLSQTNFDITILYSLLDQWSKFPNFEAMLRDEILIQQGLNRIAIGWNGASIAADTDPVANPLGQDVNKGWLQIQTENMPSMIMSEAPGGVLEGHIT